MKNAQKVEPALQQGPHHQLLRKCKSKAPERLKGKRRATSDVGEHLGGGRSRALLGRVCSDVAALGAGRGALGDHA